MGIITVKTIREANQPYTIVAVTDTHDNTSVTLDEAVTRKIIDEGRGTYRDKRKKREITIVEAIENGMVQVRKCGSTREIRFIQRYFYFIW